MSKLSTTRQDCVRVRVGHDVLGRGVLVQAAGGGRARGDLRPVRHLHGAHGGRPDLCRGRGRQGLVPGTHLTNTMLSNVCTITISTIELN